MMKRADRDAWCADLRANPDKQGRNYLSSETGDCCLGRLAKLLGVPTQRRLLTKMGALVFKFPGPDGAIDEAQQFPPDMWLREIGLDSTIAANLAANNDGGVSFPEIADRIEQLVVIED